MSGQKILSYRRETLLAFASLPLCQTRPENIDPVLWRDSISSDVVEANPAAPAVVQACILGYKDSEGGGVSIKSSQDDIPEWRRPGGGGCGGLLPPNSWRKPYDEEPVGKAFAANYPPRPGPPCINTNGSTLRPPHNRPATLIPPGRWERFGDRDHEQGHPLHDREGDEPAVAGAGGEAGQRLSAERDGLLGSGNWPSATGPGLHKRADSYQPPRPAVKTAMYGRREDNDTVNNQTFGLLEPSNDDRSLQEFKRRELFEMMRKEQHHQLQEQKQPLVKVDNPSVLRKHDESLLWDDHPHHSPPESPVQRITTSIPVPTITRPAFPPGFSKVNQLKQNISQEFQLQDNHEQGVHDAARNGVLEIQDSVVEIEKKRSETISIISNTGADDFDSRDTAKETSVEILKIVNEAVDDTSSTTGSSSVKQLHETTDLWSLNPEGHYATVDTVPDDSISRTDTSNSSEGMLLDKLFGKATPTSADDGTASADFLVESSSAISMESWSSSVDPKGSKFAQWFHFEEEKPSDETTSSSNILSLFAKREKVITIQGESHGDGGLVSTHNQGCGILPMSVAPSLEDIEKMMAAAAKEPVSSNKGSVIPAVPFNQDSPQVGQSLLPPVFMTCEDIEQSLLAEAAGNDELLGFQDFPSMMSAVLDTNASQHLLSLLQKQPSRSETLCSGGLHSKLPPKEAASKWPWRRPDPRDQTSEVHRLEALFGKDFMSELQSLQAPLPEKRFSAVKEKVERTAPFFLQSEDKYPFEAGAGEEGRQLWYGVSGPALSAMWPDSKEVDAVHRDFGDGSSSQPQIDDLKLSESEELLHPISVMGQGLWGNQNPSSEQMLMDSLNGTTSILAGPSFRSVLNGHANINRVDNGEYLKRVADREGTKEESFASTAGGNSRLLPVGDKLSLLTRTEAAMNGISLLDATKRQNLNRSSKPPGMVKDGHVNGVTRLLTHGNGPQIKAVARTAGFASFRSEGHLQQHYGPQSPPVLIEPHTRPATLQQASHGPSDFLFLHQSARAQATSPIYSHGNMDYEFDSSTARTFPAPGQMHFQPPPQAFHEGMAHQLLGPTQILQHSHFVTTMGMQEHESGNHHQVPLGASLSPPGHHGHRQLLQSHVPQMGFMSQYSSEFGNQGYKLGGYWGGTTSDSWLGMDGNLSGSRSSGLIHQPSLGAGDDLKLHFR